MVMVWKRSDEKGSFSKGLLNAESLGRECHLATHDEAQNCASPIFGLVRKVFPFVVLGAL